MSLVRGLSMVKIYLGGGREGGGYESGKGIQHGEDKSRGREGMSLVRGLSMVKINLGGGRERDMSLVRGFKYISEGEGGGYESGQGTQIYS